MKIRAVGAKLFNTGRLTDRRINGQTDRHADMRQLIVAFRGFAKAPKNKSRVKIAQDSLDF